MAQIANKIGLNDSKIRYQATTFYQYTGYVRSFLNWLKLNSWRFVYILNSYLFRSHREQIRAMTVWSASPDSEIQIVDKFADTVYKIKYCIISPERLTRFSVFILILF